MLCIPQLYLYIICSSTYSYAQIVSFFFFLMIRRPPRSTLSSSSAASDVYKRQLLSQGAVLATRMRPLAKLLRRLCPSSLEARTRAIHEAVDQSLVPYIFLRPQPPFRDCLLYTSPSPRDS
eukprot:TRINITY_DN4598_c0_g1_i3.p1 TRINITY_DN4598_c0_g1~~TRINITY_DN4598_c0_g1_i3.p1  ORF type:complete len:121 (+),score=10.60 TRINITY_DN4598_c0_g1_i3:8-370(+)